MRHKLILATIALAMMSRCGLAIHDPRHLDTPELGQYCCILEADASKDQGSLTLACKYFSDIAGVFDRWVIKECSSQRNWGISDISYDCRWGINMSNLKWCSKPRPCCVASDDHLDDSFSGRSLIYCSDTSKLVERGPRERDIHEVACSLDPRRLPRCDAVRYFAK